MTNEDLADLIKVRTDNLRDHFDQRLVAMQAHISGTLLAMESDMLDLRGDILRLKDAVATQVRANEDRAG